MSAFPTIGQRLQPIAYQEASRILDQDAASREQSGLRLAKLQANLRAPVQEAITTAPATEKTEARKTLTPSADDQHQAKQSRWMQFEMAQVALSGPRATRKGR